MAVGQLTGLERLGAASRVRAGAAVEPARTDHGLRDPCRVTEAVDDVAEEARGVGIVPIGVDRHHRAVGDLGLEGAPVRCVRHALVRHPGQDRRATEGCAAASVPVLVPSRRRRCPGTPSG
jgi:hypothetical protein